MSNPEPQTWQTLCREALAESDPQKLLPLFMATEDPIFVHLQELAQSPDGQAIGAALPTLRTVQAEKLNFPAGKIWRERHAREDAAGRYYRAHYRALMRNPSYGIFRCNKDGRCVDVNRAMLTMLGYKSKRELLVRHSAMGMIDSWRQRRKLMSFDRVGEKVQGLELDWIRKDGSPIKVRLSGAAVHYHRGGFGGYDLIVENIDQQRILAKQLRREADTDALTGIGTYRRFQRVFDAEIRRSKRTERVFTVLLLDLNGLKNINDVYGHLTGNRALCRVADALGQCCRSIDTPTRFGGDEFVIVLPETQAQAATQLAARIGRRMARQLEEPKLSVSVGFATYPKEGQNAKDLLEAADKMLYRMKATKPTVLAKKMITALSIVRTCP